MNNRVDAAMIRARRALECLNDQLKSSFMLDNTAAALIQADKLLSALSIIYREIEMQSRLNSVIGVSAAREIGKRQRKN
jgi:hypothetical protein